MWAGIGEKIKLETEEAAADSRQRAIRCTKEVVEREESQRREEALSSARDEWQEEKQQLFQEAHRNQLGAITRQTAILEKKLRVEFQNHLAQLQLDSREHLQRTVHSTWIEAEAKKNEAVANTRIEEHHLAGKEAERVANIVGREKRELRQRAEEEKIKALDGHTKLMEGVCRQALAKQQQELEQVHDSAAIAMSETYESRLAELALQLGMQAAEMEKLRTDLEEMKDSRDRWESKHRNLKMEFADFIEQFPGFRAEFILK